MTIAEFLIKCINSGLLRNDRNGEVVGMGENWTFIPNRKYGPGILVNKLTGSIMSVAELSDRKINMDYNDWQVVS